LDRQKNTCDEIQEKVFKNYLIKSMDDVNTKVDEAAFLHRMQLNARGSHHLIPLHN
jgi:hypothetical protein